MDIELPEGITAVNDPLPGLSVETAAGRGQICFNGGHVLAWTPAGADPVLWTSASSRFAAGSPIRGGVPLVWPFFGQGADGTRTPQHGFARISEWDLREATVSPSGRATITLGLTTDRVPAELRGGVPDDVELLMQVTMGSSLELRLIVQAGEVPVDFEEGLHTYFTVGDVRRVRVTGLDQAAYEDRVSGQGFTQHGDITFTGETDRIYESTDTVRIVDPVLGRTIQISKAGSAQSVVWNPWIDKSAAMADFGDDEWTGMVCVEAVNVRDAAIHLEPHQRWLLAQTIELV